MLDPIIFHRMDTKIQVLVFMSEIKFDLTLKKIKISVYFMLLFAITKLLPTLQLSRQKTELFFFFLPFRVNLVLITVLRRYSIG